MTALGTGPARLSGDRRPKGAPPRISETTALPPLELRTSVGYMVPYRSYLRYGIAAAARGPRS